VEKACGRPQDIEWAIDAKGRLWLVQTRPITAGGRQPGSERGRVYWSNANINENYPEPVSPLLYSLATTAYYHYFRNLGMAFGLAPARVAAMEQPLRHIVGAHGARLYYHLSNIHAVLRAAPFGEQLTAYFSAFTGAEEPGAIQRQVSGWRTWSEAAGMVFAGVRLFRRLPEWVAQFERTVDRFAEETTPERLAGLDLSRLLEAFRGFLDIRFHRWLGASLADAAAMISYGLLQHLLRREFPGNDQSALHNTLLKGLGDVISTEPLVELWRLSRIVRDDSEAAACFARLDNGALLGAVRAGQIPAFADALNAYLRRWGFRRSGELMLTVPGFQEDPGPLLDLVRAYGAVDGEAPAERLARQHQERAAETKRVLHILRGRRLVRWLPWPSMVSLVGRLLPWCQAAIALRERARTRQALLYARCRAVVLAIGGRLAARGDFEQADDVFFLSWQEIDDLLAGAAMFPHHVRALVRLRRQAHAEVSEKKPADTLHLAPGDYLPVGAGQPAEARASPHGFVEELRGAGACGGQAAGPAAVLHDVAECSRLAQGSILVTRQTDPGWGPAFLLISGLVLERGGMLSHGAILAREHGIPTVVGVRDAVGLIGTGQRVVVDGDRGVVRLGER
jgi:pyruvate,water dikinase